MRSPSLRNSSWFLGLIISIAATSSGAFLSTGIASPDIRPSTLGLTVVDIYDRGVMVTNVGLGSEAMEAGIRNGDVILAVNGMPVLFGAIFQRLLLDVSGYPVILTVSRFGQIYMFRLRSR